MYFLLVGETFWVENGKISPDEGGDFEGMSANGHLPLPTKLEQNKPLMVTFAEDLSKASLHHALWGELALSSPVQARKLKGKLATIGMLICTEVPADELHAEYNRWRESPEEFV